MTLRKREDIAIWGKQHWIDPVEISLWKWL